MPTLLQVFHLPRSSWEAQGAEKQLGRCPSTCAGSPNCHAFPAPTSDPSVGPRDQHRITAQGQNNIGVTPFSGWFHPVTQERSPLGPPTPAHRVPVLALLGTMLRGPNPSRQQPVGTGNGVSLGKRGCQPLPGLPRCREWAPTSSSQPTAIPYSPSSPAPAS